MKKTEPGINAIIDGFKVECQKGTSILEAARQVGIKIPTLCYSPDLKPTGVCRICVVEIEGARTLVGSCHTPITNGMTIHTKSPKVLKARRATVELSMAGHTGECVADINARNCELRNLADLLESGVPKFLMRKPRWYPIEEFNPYVRRDMSRCILCRKCVSACQEIAKKNIFSIAYRGFDSKVVFGFDEALTTEVCRNCGICIEYCPTGALQMSKAKSE